MRQIKEIIIHCTATWPNVAPKAIKKFHIEENGWKDIGYHFIIDENGYIWRGRNVSEVGAHCAGRNTNSIGIAYIGGLNSEQKPANTMNKQQMISMYRLTESLKLAFGLTIDDIRMHNEFANKACPCFDKVQFKSMMYAVQQDMYNYCTNWFNL